MLRAIKRRVLPVHRWTGLTVGFVIVVMALTGGLQAFRVQIEPLVSGQILSVPSCEGRVSIDALTKIAQEQNPDSQLDFIRIAPGSREGLTTTTWIRFLDKKTYYFNPCTGELLGEMGRYRGPFGSIENIHRFRWMENGSLITGTVALITVVVMIFGGLILWAPANRKGLRPALKLNRSAKGRNRMIALHRFTGVYAAAILLTSALTGLPQAFPWFKEIVYRVAGSEPPAPAPVSLPHEPGAEPITLQTALDIGLKTAGPVREIQLRYPQDEGAAIQGFYIDRDAPHPNARSIFDIDAYTGKVLDHVPYASNTSGHQFYFWTLSWHQGLAFGLLTEILVFLGAFSVLVLAYTGITSWWRALAGRSAQG